MRPTAEWRSDSRSAFYRICAWAALAVATAGFFLTYTLPVARGVFHGPRWADVHGALLLAWLVLVIVQTNLVRRRIRWHRRLGWTAVVLAPAIAASTMAIGHAAAERDLALGMGPIAVSSFLGTVTASLVFLLLVGIAIGKRADPQWHKRAIFVATVAILWPAWFRWRHFLPWVPRPDITLGLVAANLPILLAMVRDRLRFGAVHPAYWCLGLGLIAEQTVEMLAFDSSAWRVIAQFAYGAMP